MKSNEAINAFLTSGYDTRLYASRLLKEAGAGLPFGRIVKDVLDEIEQDSHVHEPLRLRLRPC